jgi:alpha-amylase/alpha-mannosidase (GH57 family)
MTEDAHGDVTLVVHGHFYQPPRENPWTEEVSVEPSAAPFHDWNARITAESYRPNGWARVLDERGRVAEIVDNYEHLSFNVGPTLLSWLQVHAPDVYERMLEGDRAGGGAIAQAYNHAILPLCDERDALTQIRWGLADFAHRFGRPATGLWLPETAANDAVLALLVEEGVAFTILAPGQAVAVRPLDARGDDGAWVDVRDGSVVGGRPHRWFHPDGERSMTLVFYDGGISHDLAFGLTGLSTQELLRRVRDAAGDGSPVCIATDGETFGHHHKFAERALAYAFAHEAAANGIAVANANRLVGDAPPTHEVRIHESAWSCAHGVGRWKEDCGCSTGGEPGWSQAWRAPLRAALDVVRNHGKEVFERRAAAVLRDPWAARDAYIDVVLGPTTIDGFLAEHAPASLDDDQQVEAATLLEAQRHALLMYTSCGWFFNDLAGIETIQVLRYAARAIDLLDQLGEADGLLERFLDVLGDASSNVPEEGDGRTVWANHVEPARVDAERVVGHLALVTLLQDGELPTTLAGYDVDAHPHQEAERGGLRGVAGAVVLRHRRTRRRSDHVYAAVHLGGLEVFGATRPVDPARDPQEFAELAQAVAEGARVSTLLRLIAERFGPREFGLDSALPDAAEQIVTRAADDLADRFAGTYERLYGDHRPMLSALVRAGYPLPTELRAPAELALARRFEAAVADGRYDTAADIAEAARRGGFTLVTPRAVATIERTLLAAVEAAVADPEPETVGAALDVLRLARHLDLQLDLDRAQEAVYTAREEPGDAAKALTPLAEALYLVT